MKKLLFAAVLAAAAGLVAGPATLAQDEALMLGVGVGTGTVSGNVFAPGDVSVHAGDTVVWTIESDEPHTVTFGTGPEDVPPPFWEPTFDIPPEPLEPVDLETSYDGSGFVHTGVIPSGSTLAMTFESEGSFSYLCAIHPGMAGTVNVVPEDEPATTQAEADAAADATAQEILAPEEDLRADTIAALTSEEQPDGTTLWTLSTAALTDPGPVAGGGTGYLELLEYLPPDLTIGAGDTVRWQFPAPHTVTFLEPGQDPASLGDPFAVEVTETDVYDGESLYNSGILGIAPGGTYELTFPDAGTFGYVCLLHGPLGQAGTIEVQPADAPPVVGSGPGPDGGSNAWLIALLAGVAGVALLASGLALKTRLR